ncbi:hypothetical protein S83_051129 [Arachis hypogaea]
MPLLIETARHYRRLHPKKIQEKFLQERIKVGGKAGALGDSVTVSCEKNKRGLRIQNEVCALHFSRNQLRSMG